MKRYKSYVSLSQYGTQPEIFIDYDNYEDVEDVEDVEEFIAEDKLYRYERTLDEDERTGN